MIQLSSTRHLIEQPDTRRSGDGATFGPQTMVLAAAMVLAMSTWFSVSAVLPDLGAELGLSSAAKRFTVAAVQVGFVSGAVAVSLFEVADRVRPHRLAAGGSAAAALFNLVPIFVATSSALVTARFAVGICMALVYPQLLRAATTWFSQGRAFVLSLLIGSLTVGSALPNLIGGSFGPSWQVVVVASSASAASAAVILTAWARCGPLAPNPARVDLRVIPRLLERPQVRAAFAGYCGHMWELYAAWATLPIFLATFIDGGPALPIMSFAVIAVGAAGCLLGSSMAARSNAATVARRAVTISGSIAVVVGFTPGWSPILAGALCLAWGLVLIADGPQFISIVSSTVEREAIGTVFTLQLAAGFGVSAVSVLLTPAVADVEGWGPAFALLAVGPAIGSIAMRRLEPPLTTPSTLDRHEEHWT